MSKADPGESKHCEWCDRMISHPAMPCADASESQLRALYYSADPNTPAECQREIPKRINV